MSWSTPISCKEGMWTSSESSSVVDGNRVKR
nr:MAG TPA: hypothetical protein [Caudoviricetes sp.]